jgi:hypothetical protein
MQPWAAFGLPRSDSPDSGQLLLRLKSSTYFELIVKGRPLPRILLEYSEGFLVHLFSWYWLLMI